MIPSTMINTPIGDIRDMARASSNVMTKPSKARKVKPANIMKNPPLFFSDS